MAVPRVWMQQSLFPWVQGLQIYKFKFDLQPGSLTDQVKVYKVGLIGSLVVRLIGLFVVAAKKNS